MPTLQHRLLTLDTLVHRWLVAHSLRLLRISVGAIFLLFGVLKFFPGVSPAQDLVEATTDLLFLGLVPGGVALVLVATMECSIGLMLLTGRGLRAAMLLLAAQFVGILSPLVLLTGRLFAGPHHAPTLEGQYVIKDVILLAAALVLATQLRGGRLVPGDHSAAPTASDHGARRFSPQDKLAIVMSAVRGDRTTDELLAHHGISQEQLDHWHGETLAGALRTLASHDQGEPLEPVADGTARRGGDRELLLPA